MGKGVTRKVKGNKKYRYDISRRKDNRKKKNTPKITCPQIRNAWDKKKSLRSNLEEMGLCFDPNETFPIPQTKDILKFGSLENYEKLDAGKKKNKKKAKKDHIAKELEDEANQPNIRPRSMADQEVKYCIYMMEKYGEDYEAMARDYKNYYQDTPTQIRKKINKFKNMPQQYKEYLQSKKVEKMDTN